MTSAIDEIEYEGMLFGRHLAALPAGRTRRKGGQLDQSAYTLLSLLDAGGPASLAERFEDPDGGQARKLRLSAEGSRLLGEERTASRALLADLLHDWSEQDRARFGELLGRYNRVIEDRSKRHWPRP